MCVVQPLHYDPSLFPHTKVFTAQKLRQLLHAEATSLFCLIRERTSSPTTGLFHRNFLEHTTMGDFLAMA